MSETLTGTEHLTAEQRAALAKLRATVDATFAKLRTVIDAAGPTPHDRNTRARISRAVTRAGDARQEYDVRAEAWGAPLLPPLTPRRSKPAGPRPRSTDEAAITAAKDELTAITRRRAADDWTRGRRMGRGIQAVRRGDAQLRRHALYNRKATAAKAALHRLGVPETEIQATEDDAWSSVPTR